MSLKLLFSTSSTATGGGRDGHVKSDSGRLDLDTRPPAELGGNGEGTNPEELFSAGYAACFLGAVHAVARAEHATVPDDASVSVKVGFGKTEHGFGINAAITASLPGLDQSAAEDLVAKAHKLCPYSNATRGNIDVDLTTQV
ncbi:MULTISPECIES: organic hydroperoxide resistance protein [Tsukamurella]|uniref:Organic hydroperoxide resistance protein n=2 Tax=Tsukamurella strandjordii TaxID=147577 RepID=A0AA90NDG1_9ACTN|nr:MULTISPECIES: organic hydroperoxide resistance protein [Tsukamurella]MDP0399888.1 organic hydroperoxide resistance protein [Tsukamurella strandjordii]GIZ97491.1 organic hydroperoxide resistance protein [Tsukamurella sp. TY48]